MDYVKSTVLPYVANTVKDKVISYAKDYLCNDEQTPAPVKKTVPKIVKKFGMGGRPIRRLGVSNQPVLRKMGV